MDCIEIARDGDLLLRVQETSTLRVSALVLRTTSEVFGAMLGPHFAEGRAFRSNSTTETPRLDLPEDDAQGMKLLCCVLHQRNDLLEDDITVAQLHSLAVVADKYACTKAVQYTATCWFSRMSNQTIKNHAIDIISASYLLNHAESFARMTNLVAKECKDNVLRLLAAIAPASETVVTLQDSIRKTQEAAASALRKTIGDMAAWSSQALESTFDHNFNQGPNNLSAKRCDLNDQAARQCQKALIEAGVWKPSYSRITLPLLVSSIDRLVAPGPAAVRSCEAAHCVSWQKTADFGRQVTQLKQQAKDVSAGVCLDCFKAGGRFEGECRFKHDK